MWVRISIVLEKYTLLILALDLKDKNTRFESGAAINCLLKFEYNYALIKGFIYFCNKMINVEYV